MNEEAKLIVETLRYCEESGARCGGCPSGVLRCLSPGKIADLIKSLSEQLEQVTQERDAYLKSIEGLCAACKKAPFCILTPVERCKNWQWRGVEVE